MITGKLHKIILVTRHTLASSLSFQGLYASFSSSSSAECRLTGNICRNSNRSRGVGMSLSNTCCLIIYPVHFEKGNKILGYFHNHELNNINYNILPRLFNNTQTLKFKTQLTIEFFTAVNHNYDDNQCPPPKKKRSNLPITTHGRDPLNLLK